MENNWELHKKLCREGNNENQIAVLIRNDDLDNFIKFVSQNSKFNFNSKIPFSIYDREPILQDCTLIQYAAFYSSIKIFKYLLVQKAELKETIYNYAFVGGDLELIHLCEDSLISNSNSDNKNTVPRRLAFFLNREEPKYYDTSIMYHHNDILKWVLETKKIQHKAGGILNEQSPLIQMGNNSNLIHLCLQSSSYISLHYLLTQEFYYPSVLADFISFDLMDLAKFSLNFKFLQTDDSKLNGNAFYEACKSNNIEYLKLFIEDKSILPYQKEKRYSDSFINACSNNKCDFVELILSNLTEMDINKKNYMDESPLYIACKNGNADLLRILIKYHLNDMKFNVLEKNETVF